VLLAIIMGLTTFGSRRLGFNKEDEITIVFCGSRRAWPRACPWPRCCSPAVPSAWCCCR
jgi:sodium/bile acid cotransporter 7